MEILNAQEVVVKTVKQTIDEQLRENRIYAPRHLSRIGQYQYQKIVLALKNKGIYEELDNGVIEQAAMAYEKSRDPELDSKELRNWSMLYTDLMQKLGATPRGRYQIKLETMVSQAPADPDLDLKEAFGG